MSFDFVDTSGPKDPNAETLYKGSYRILIQVVQKDPHMAEKESETEICDASGLKEFLNREIQLIKGSLKQRSCPTRF